MKWTRIGCHIAAAASNQTVKPLLILKIENISLRVLGVTRGSKIDVFLEKVQTTFDPPLLVFGFFIALFLKYALIYVNLQ